MIKILLFGMILFDLIDGKNHIGGPPLNVALHIARMGEAPVLLSAVGNDDLGREAYRILGNEGVSTKYVGTNSHETGRAAVVVDDNGIPVFDIKRNTAYDFIEITEEQLLGLSKDSFDLLYFGTVEQQGEVTSQSLKTILKRMDIKDIFYDINLREGHFSKEIVDFSLRNTTILKLNEEEILQLNYIFELELNEDAMLDWLFSSYGIKIVLITRGGNGASVVTREAKKDVDGIKVRIKDTVGSGDAFSAGFIVTYLKTGDVAKAVSAGNALGAFVAAHTGAVPDKENMDELI